MTNQQRKKRKNSKSSFGSCLRAGETAARATVYVWVHMSKGSEVMDNLCVPTEKDAGSAAEKDDCRLF